MRRETIRTNNSSLRSLKGRGTLHRRRSSQSRIHGTRNNHNRSRTNRRRLNTRAKRTHKARSLRNELREKGSLRVRRCSTCFGNGGSGAAGF